MEINLLFNETELTMFQRQTGFTFGDFFKTADGVLFAVDSQSGQLFIGRDLLKVNVHKFGNVSSVRQETGGIVLEFKGSSPVRINVGLEDAGQLVALLEDIIEESTPDNIIEEPEADVQHADMDENSVILSNEEQAEFYSRLVNTGRSQAIGYLVSETGMNVEDACRYVDKREEAGNAEEPSPELDPDYYRDGTMTKKAVLETVKRLKPGDRIHLEFKPLIGKLRVYDAEYLKLRVDTWGGRNTSA